MKKLLAVLITLIALIVLLSLGVVSASAEEVSANGYLVGDIDMDKEISIKDATLAQMYVSKFADFNEAYKFLMPHGFRCMFLKWVGNTQQMQMATKSVK